MAEAKKQALSLPESVFAVEIPNHELLKAAYEMYLANGRGNYAKTLTRGEVSGGGKKPWKQKGTGRARFGSSRNPIWRKGGIAFGPTGLENYTKAMPVKAKRLAIRQALTLAARENEIVIADALPTSGKTKDMADYLSSHGLTAANNTVVVVDNKTDMLMRASRNIPNVQVVQATYLNAYTILNADKLIMTPQAITAVEGWLGA